MFAADVHLVAHQPGRGTGTLGTRRRSARCALEIAARRSLETAARRGAELALDARFTGRTGGFFAVRTLDAQRTFLGGHPGQRGGDTTGVELEFGFHLADQRLEEAEFFGFDHIQHLLLEARDPAVREVGLGGQRHGCDRLARGALDELEHAALARRDEEDRAALAAGPAGAADTVHIGFGVVGDVVVDDVAHARHVDAPGSHVGGHDEVDVAGAQLLDGALAQRLLQIAVQCCGGVTPGGQLVGEFDRGGLGAHEDDGGVEVLFGFEDAGQRVELVGAAHLPVALRDLRHSGGGGGNLDLLRIAQVAVRHATDRLRHGGREERHLTFARQRFEDLVDCVDEAHAQHLIGFVEHHHRQRVGVEAFALEVIDHPARRADDDLRPARQLLELHAQALSAVDRQDLEARHEVGVFLEGFGDLDGELARRREHQHLGLVELGIDARQQRQREGCGLAGTGLGLAQHVLAFEQQRDTGGLDGGRVFVADRTEGTQQRLWQAEVGKAGRSVGIGGLGFHEGDFHGGASSQRTAEIAHTSRRRRKTAEYCLRFQRLVWLILHRRNFSCGREALC